MFDVASKYCFALDKDPKKSLNYYSLLSNIEKYVNGAIIEMRRLSRIRKAITEEFKTRSRKKTYLLTYLANDTHFYFICIDKVYKLVFRLGDELKDSDIKKLAEKLRVTFDIKTVRDHLEHIDARCLGFLSWKDERKKISRHIPDFGNFFNDSFSFNGKSFPSDKGSLSELNKIYNDLIVILTKKYASKDPGFIWREQSEKRYQAIMRVVKKAGLLRYWERKEK